MAVMLSTRCAPVVVVADETGHPIQVYFSRRLQSDDDFTAVFPVSRTSPDVGVARAALRELIAGPTPAETDDGYFSELGQMLVGPSDCGEDGFTIRIADGVATLRFCRDVRSAGIGQDARAQRAIDATLTQFPTIRRVRILTREGDCLFDMSGDNRCLTAATSPASLQWF
jgi:spore germination protein GerM